MVPLPFEQPNPTRLLSGLLPEVSNRLRDLGRLKRIILYRSTASSHSAAKLPRTTKLPLILSCRCLRGDSADCYLCLLLEHLPSTTGAPPIFQHNSATCKATKFTGSGLPGCPRTEVRGGKSGQTLPFPASRQDHLTTPGRQIFPALTGVKS